MCCKLTILNNECFHKIVCACSEKSFSKKTKWTEKINYAVTQLLHPEVIQQIRCKMMSNETSGIYKLLDPENCTVKLHKVLMNQGSKGAYSKTQSIKPWFDEE